MIAPKVAKPTPADERRAYATVTRRDNNTCQRCLRDCGPIARDHRKNRSQGGRTTPANLQLLGLGCHTWKGANGREANRTGWGVPGSADPTVWPARRWEAGNVGTVHQIWVLYDARGGFHEISEGEALRRMEGAAA